MASRVVLDGFEELKAELRQLPEALVSEATSIVTDSASRMKTEVGAVYRAHRRSGALANGLSSSTKHTGRFGVVAEVRSNGRLAWLWDNGSQARHWRNGKSTGQMPPAHTFSGAAARHRRTMWDRLADLVRGKGFQVIGRAA